MKKVYVSNQVKMSSIKELELKGYRVIIVIK